MSKALKITHVQENMHAAQLGLEVDDLLISYDGIPICTNTELTNEIYEAKKKAKNSVTLVISRTDTEISLQANPNEELGITSIECEFLKKSENQVSEAKTNNVIQNVVVQDISMSFGSMVFFMVKWVLASIPALMILALIFWFVSVVFGVGINLIRGMLI